jgi:hypothetical protein
LQERERIQPAGERVEDGAVRAGDAEGFTPHERDRDAGAPEPLDARCRRLGPPRIGGHFQTPAPPERTGRMGGGELLGEIDAAARERVDAPRLGGIGRGDAVDPVQDLPAVAPARPVAESAGLEEHHPPLGPAARQMPGRRYAGEPAAHDDDVRHDRAAQRRGARRGRRFGHPCGTILVELTGGHALRFTGRSALWHLAWPPCPTSAPRSASA